jgi:hypothetical protein
MWLVKVDGHLSAKDAAVFGCEAPYGESFSGKKLIALIADTKSVQGTSPGCESVYGLQNMVEKAW